MVSFDIDSTRFNYRAGGVALRGDHVLLTRLIERDFWFLPGGRIDIRESAADGLRREVREELREDAEVGRLLWVVETFYTEPSGRSFHEVGLYFEMRFPPASPIMRASGPVPGHEVDYAIEFQWFPVGALNTIVLYPPFLVEGLQNPSGQITHVMDIR